MANIGGPAFPHFSKSRQNSSDGHTFYQGIETGMSLRDYFAAKAMQAYIGKYSHQEDIARLSYNLADAMLKQKDLK